MLRGSDGWKQAVFFFCLWQARLVKRSIWSKNYSNYLPIVPSVGYFIYHVLFTCIRCATTYLMMIISGEPFIRISPIIAHSSPSVKNFRSHTSENTIKEKLNYVSFPRTILKQLIRAILYQNSRYLFCRCCLSALVGRKRARPQCFSCLLSVDSTSLPWRL